ncbi:MAG: integrin alpha, partial [Thermoplasmata archaeon]
MGKKTGLIVATMMLVSVGFAIATPAAAVRNYWDWDSVGYGQRYSQFGASVAGDCDVNNDGYDDVIVGSYMYDTSEIDAGLAFLYLGSPYGLNKN